MTAKMRLTSKMLAALRSADPGTGRFDAHDQTIKALSWKGLAERRFYGCAYGVITKEGREYLAALGDADTSAQAAVLAVVDKHGASFVTFRTNAATNEVAHAAVDALFNRGVLVRYLSADGVFARRANAS
jgi:hypothetical protein